MERTNSQSIRIDVSDAIRKDIANFFEVKYITIWRALNFREDSALSQSIRKYALMKGGRKIVETHVNDSLVWDEQQQLFVQHFDNDYCMTIDNMGTLCLYDDLKLLITRKEGVNIGEMTKIQQFAKQAPRTGEIAFP